MEAKPEVTVLQQLMLLKGMTIRTGAIHEAQALQLRNWGLLVPGTKKAKAQPDKERKMITYTLDPIGDDIEPTEEVIKWCKAIDRWTKQLLWPETTVVLKCKKTVLYDSRQEK